MGIVFTEAGTLYILEGFYLKSTFYADQVYE